MIQNVLERLAEETGFSIGTSDDVTQAKLLNRFADGFNNSILNQHNKNMQVAYVVDKLSVSAENLILLFSEFIKEKQKNK